MKQAFFLPERALPFGKLVENALQEILGHVALDDSFDLPLDDTDMFPGNLHISQCRRYAASSQPEFGSLADGNGRASTRTKFRQQQGISAGATVFAPTGSLEPVATSRGTGRISNQPQEALLQLHENEKENIPAVNRYFAMHRDAAHSAHQLAPARAPENIRRWIVAEASKNVHRGIRLLCDLFLVLPGDPWALVELGGLYARKLKNYQLSLQCFALAAERGSALGMACLGDQFRRGLGVAQNRVLGQRLVDKAKTAVKSDIRQAQASGVKPHFNSREDVFVRRSKRLSKDAIQKSQIDVGKRGRAFRQ
mmetsp:Transcript_2543/g.5870  ORF Transcript_2543/g.5870 Transcript_2543/m.5870 type:complete len:309 (+) Transcript_2543:135-1061(+)|eukprot:CAMPEP_0198353552 /NCGR_PEP_ID=MMETSP1450-20131203/111766_1 /TAXON_ID=753684 ORGANISM="Madagascaria erythrocladiodes, Strain CCMP3234" /NCGR_SAMPLE_ID=MMETSP1450 /ASSEMBLY_ACC=CAM_ASM_001115 /LENGTH=308 /DNA_ID=CAMNT_0044059703 /DNA_START=48 /DNA_END=974 /DNA_ORIENTATION=+